MQRLARKRLVLLVATLCLLLLMVREIAMTVFPITPTCIHPMEKDFDIKKI